jgi:hypothetical protein
MALKLVKMSKRAPEQVSGKKSRADFLLACLRDELKRSKFSDWERGFIASLARQLDSGRELSDKQRCILEKIWDK